MLDAIDPASSALMPLNDLQYPDRRMATAYLSATGNRLTRHRICIFPQ
jgi:hypothetical protein